MKDFFEIQFWKIAKYIIEKGYGADCIDFEKECSSCRAKQVIDWINEHISLLRF